jgi:DtxR family Mn-dependent transcriptional regulator
MRVTPSSRSRSRRRRAPGLTPSRQDYLKALYDLGQEGGPIPTSLLARRVAVSAPSVTNMLGRLAAEGLVRHAPRAGARLTESGERAALGMLRRHRVLETFLVRVLGLDWSEAHEDAEVLEHGASDRVIEALDRLMRHPREDPHGHPIPDARGRVVRRALSPLALLPGGESGTVREIRDRDRGRMARWKQAGLVPGARVRMRAVRALDDVFELDVDGRRMITGSEGLEGVLVERARERSHGRRR